MPFNAATLRLCSRRMFSWDTLRLGCLRKHCMIQRGAQGEASGVRKDGGPRHPCGDPCSSRSLRCAQCQTGLQGGSGGSGRGRQRKAGEGRVQLGVEPWEVSPPALLTSFTHWMQNYTEAPAGSCPGRRNKFSYSHMPVGFYASFPGAGGVPNIVCGS